MKYFIFHTKSSKPDVYFIAPTHLSLDWPHSKLSGAIGPCKTWKARKDHSQKFMCIRKDVGGKGRVHSKEELKHSVSRSLTQMKGEEILSKQTLYIYMLVAFSTLGIPIFSYQVIKMRSSHRKQFHFSLKYMPDNNHTWQLRECYMSGRAVEGSQVLCRRSSSTRADQKQEDRWPPRHGPAHHALSPGMASYGHPDWVKKNLKCGQRAQTFPGRV